MMKTMDDMTAWRHMMDEAFQHGASDARTGAPLDLSRAMGFQEAYLKGWSTGAATRTEVKNGIRRRAGDQDDRGVFQRGRDPRGS